MPKHQTTLLVSNILTIAMHFPIVLWRLTSQVFSDKMTGEWSNSSEEIVLEGNPVVIEWEASNFCIAILEGKVLVRANRATVFPSVNHTNIALTVWNVRGRIELKKSFVVIGVEKTMHSSGVIAPKPAPNLSITEKLNIKRYPRRVQMFDSFKLSSPKSIKKIKLKTTTYGREFL